MELSTWLTFFLAAWAISLSPGAGAVAAMSAGLNHGFKHGYFMTLGLVLGIWTQIVVVGLGLGALIAASSFGFALVKWLPWTAPTRHRCLAIPWCCAAG
jgi:homoserine/homoserine lactone efflux protein